MSKIKIFSLGGLNENGKNMYVVEVNKDIFILDAGLKYASDFMLGVDYIIPNFDYLKENKDNIKGIFVTHGHDSQMGAIPDIISEIPDIKVYGTDFTIDIIKNELLNEKLPTDNLVVIEPHKVISFGSVSIFPVSLTHSVPGSVGYAINTNDGVIFYTGNFVFDQTMSGPYKTDIGKLAYIGKQGVLCLLSESLYADKIGYTSPNNRIKEVIDDTLQKYEGRIFFNIFQAQLYRIQELFSEIMLTDRNVIILGKRIENMIMQAIEKKYINFDKNRIVGINHINDENIVIILSDEREKPFSNILRIAKGYDKFIKLNKDDTVIFASPVYDGMEKSATDVYDRIARIGAELVILPTKKYLGHHASREDLMMMINLMNPKYYFPVIGEYRHQVANKETARMMDIDDENIILALNGDVIEFDNGVLNPTISKIKVDEILIDGNTLGDVGELVLKDRELLSDSGVVIVSATLDKTSKKILAGPEILSKGFIYARDNIDLIKESEKIVTEIIKENTKPNYVDFNKIKLNVRDKLGKYLYKETECKPMILIVIQEI